MKYFLQRYADEILEWTVSAALFVAAINVLVANYWKFDAMMLQAFGGPPVFRGISTALSGYGIVHLPTAALTFAMLAAGLLANPVANMAIDALKRWAIHMRHIQIAQEAIENAALDSTPDSVSAE